MNLNLDFFEALRRMKARRERAGASPLPVGEGGVQSHAPLNAGWGSEAKPSVSGSVEPPPQPLPTGERLTIGPAGLALIKRFEGCAKRRADGRFEAYPDPGTGGDPWTIGWGATGKGIARGTVWTQAECDDRLTRDLIRFARDVARALGDAPTTQPQFDALVSFHYNTGAIAKATLTKLHKAGEFDAAAAEFGKWVHAGGKRLNGLVRRREAEASLYQNG